MWSAGEDKCPAVNGSEAAKNIFATPKKNPCICNLAVIISLIAGTKVGRTGGSAPAKLG